MIFSFLSKTLNKDASEIASLVENEDGELKEDALDALLDLDKTRVETLKGKSTEMFDNGYKKAEKEVRKKVERELKEEFDIDSTSTGDELLTEIKTKLSTSNSDFTEEDIKSSETYKKMRETLEKEYSEKTEQIEGSWKEKYSELETSITKEKNDSRIKESIKAKIKELKPILPQDETKANNQLSIVVDNIFNNSEYELTEDGNIRLLRDGKLLEDAHGNSIKFEDYVKEKASTVLDFGEPNQRQSSGGAEPDGSIKVTFKDEKDFQQKLASAETMKEKGELITAWENREK